MKISNYEKPNWINENEDKITYFTGSTGWENLEDAKIYSEISGLEIEIYIPKNTQMELF